jgi:hypothetical protein
VCISGLEKTSRNDESGCATRGAVGSGAFHWLLELATGTAELLPWTLSPDVSVTLSGFAQGPANMIEINEIRNQIADLGERVEALRRYL